MAAAKDGTTKEHFADKCREMYPKAVLGSEPLESILGSTKYFYPSRLLGI